MAQIQARSFHYRHASRKAHALQDVTFDVEKGERILLLGESGAGKSTLLAAIAGLLAPDEGETAGELRVDATVGMVLQDPDSQVIASKVGDDVAFGCENLGVPREEIWRRVPRALELVGLSLPLDHPTAELSGGQKQRLALAGVIAMGTDLILLDEPTANLDPQGIKDVVDAVKHVADETGATVIVVEHRVEIWREFAERAIVLGHEHVLADADIETVISEQGESLAEAGVWMPGVPLLLPKAHTPERSDCALRTENLVVGWDKPLNGSSPHNLSIPRGNSTVITGKNGSGKSTLLLTLAGLLPSHSGKVEVSPQIREKFKLGCDPITWKSTHLAQTFGYVFQDPEHQFVSSTVREELEVAPRASGQKIEGTVAQRIEELLSRLRLDHLAEANPFTLSGGQKRRLSVATTLVTAPEVVFLDEPTFGQDRRTFTELVALVRELTSEGTTVCSITHDDLYIGSLGDEVIAL